MSPFSSARLAFTGTERSQSKFRGNLFLYAVGNGDIIQFNPNDVDGSKFSENLNTKSIHAGWNEIFDTLDEKIYFNWLADENQHYSICSILPVSAPVSLGSDVLSAVKCGCKYKTEMCFERDRRVIVIGSNSG